MDKPIHQPQPISESELAELTRAGRWMNSYRLPGGHLTRPLGGGSVKDRRKTQLVQSFAVSGKTVLDIGCSEGMYSFYMAEKGATVLGLDLDETRIRKADFVRRALGFENVRFAAGNILDPRDQKHLSKVDLIVAWGFLHRIPDPFTALSLMASRCDSISLEWRMPAMLFPPGFGAATRGRSEVGERLAAAGTAPATDNWAAETPLSAAAEYWRLNVGAVISMLQPFGFSRFSTYTIRNETTWRNVIVSWTKLLAHHLVRRNSLLYWGPSRRIHLLAEKRPVILSAARPGECAFTPAPWDGRFGA